MPPSTSPRAPRARQSRKSIAHLPQADLVGDKENATMDSAALSSLSAQANQKVKKPRSKSIGPGGIDALKEGSGNRTVRVPHHHDRSLMDTNKSSATPPSEVDIEAHCSPLAPETPTATDYCSHAIA